MGGSTAQPEEEGGGVGGDGTKPGDRMVSAPLAVAAAAPRVGPRRLRRRGRGRSGRLGRGAAAAEGGEGRGRPRVRPGLAAPLAPAARGRAGRTRAARPVTRSARCGREGGVERGLGPAMWPDVSLLLLQGLAGHSRPRCRRRSSRCPRRSGPGPGRGLLVSCGCCDPLERARGDRLRSEKRRVLFGEL